MTNNVIPSQRYRYYRVLSSKDRSIIVSQRSIDLTCNFFSSKNIRLIFLVKFKICKIFCNLLVQNFLALNLDTCAVFMCTAVGNTCLSWQNQFQR